MDAVAWVDPHALLSRSFADAAIARALHFSLSDDYCSSASPVFTEQTAVADLGAASASMAAPPSSFCGHAAAVLPPREAPPSARCRLGPAGGRAGKRRPRPSKRVPTTYISTDAATFRLMVQHVTGAEADINADPSIHLPPFDDVEHYLLPPEDPALSASHVAAYVLSPPAPEQPYFPTLDSWNVMYEKNEARGLNPEAISVDGYSKHAVR